MDQQQSTFSTLRFGRFTIGGLLLDLKVALILPLSFPFTTSRFSPSLLSLELFRYFEKGYLQHAVILDMYMYIYYNIDISMVLTSRSNSLKYMWRM